MHITKNDREVCSTLSRRVRVLSIEQIARTWFHASERYAERRLQLLKAAGWLESMTLFCETLMPTTEPVFSWVPASAFPDFRAISSALRNRWTGKQKCIETVIAGKQSLLHFGASKAARPPRLLEESHDLLLSEVYLQFLSSRNPARQKMARRWVGEGDLFSEGYGKHCKLPDALCRMNRKTVVVECGGAYSSSKLAAFHAAFSHWEYELW